MKKVLFTATVDSHILAFHIPFLKYFKEQGYEVHVATNGNAEIPYCDVKHIITFERSPFKLNNLRATKQLKKIIDSENYEIIHTHTPMGGVITRLAAIDARKSGTLVVYTAHGFHFYNDAPMLNWLIYYPIEKWMSKYTDILITINREDFERAKNRFYTKNTYRIDGIGVDTVRFTPVSSNKKNKLRKEYGYNEEDFILIYAAELNKNKNQEFLITQVETILKDIPNVKLLICGVGNLQDSYVRKINELGVGNAINLMGYRKDINQLFRISDICVASSIREGLGLNLAEAMATGLPVVASNNRGHRDVVEQGIHGYLYGIDDSEKFREYILALYNDRQMIKKIGKNNISYADKYSLQNTLHNMMGIYDVSKFNNHEYSNTTRINRQ